jgi:PGF-pre-PGF domain-containing protein
MPELEIITDEMKFKLISLGLCGFLLISLMVGAPLSARIETDVPGEDLPDVPRYPGMVRTSYSVHPGLDNYYTISISYQGTADFTAVKDFYKAEMPKHGWTLSHWYSYDSYASLSFAKKGFSASISISTFVWENVGETYVFIFYSPQRVHEITIPENASLDLLLEFKSTGRCRIKVDYSGPNPLLYYLVRPADPVFRPVAPVRRPAIPGPSPTFAASAATSASPAQPVSWDINIELSSPREGALDITANGWAVLPLPEEQKRMLSLAVAAYNLAPATFNQQVLQKIQRQLMYTTDLEITALNITKLEWDSAASKLTFGVAVSARSPKFDATLQKELPMNIYTTGSGSIPTVMTPESIKELTLDVMFRFIGKTTTAELRANFVGLACTIGIDWESDLPWFDEKGVVTRADNIIVVDFGKMREYWPAYVTTPEIQAHENIRFTLRVPSGAAVENLPSGYTQTDSAYTWTGTSAANALLALITGEAGTRISYWVGPATVTIENIQASVGQTVEVENRYVTSVKIESERVIGVEFEKDQPVRKLRVTLATAVNNINVQAQRLPEKPAGVIEPPAEKGIVHHYLEMKTDAPEQVESAIIEFRVSKLWISVNNIDQTTVRLLRYQDGEWTELQTAQTGEDENNVYFSAETTGFSMFAITGIPAQLPTVPAPLLPPLGVIIVVALALVVVLVLVMWRYLSR